MNHMSRQPNVDNEKVGLISWSAGGVAHAMMQTQNDQIDVLVSLDGAMGYAYGDAYLRDSPFFDSTRVNVPFFHAHGLAPAQYEVKKSFTFFESWATSDAYLVTLDELSHGDFMSRIVIQHMALGTERADRITAGYANLAKATLAFLDAHLRLRPGAQEQLMELNNVEGMSVVHRP